MKLSIIVPVYNEAATLAEVIARVLAVSLPGYDREVIVVDDGSSDETPAVVAALLRQHPDVLRSHRALINLGKGAAVRAGMHLATGDLILVQDADLELTPDDHPALLAPFADPAVTVVYGSRFRHGRPPGTRWANYLANRGLTLLTNLLFGCWLTDMATAYKVFRRETLRGLRLRAVGFDIEPEITARVRQAGHRIREVPIRYVPRTAAQGKKIRAIHALDYVYMLGRCRITR